METPGWGSLDATSSGPAGKASLVIGATKAWIDDLIGKIAQGEV
jgi:hypothetical protein